MKWELAEEQMSVMGAGGEYTPTQYPRSGNDRDIGRMNKGGASQADNIDASVATNSTGNVSVPRHADTPIDYADDGDEDGVQPSEPSDREYDD